jgi:hypothetical protein
MIDQKALQQHPSAVPSRSLNSINSASLSTHAQIGGFPDIIQLLPNGHLMDSSLGLLPPAETNNNLADLAPLSFDFLSTTSTSPSSWGSPLLSQDSFGLDGFLSPSATEHANFIPATAHESCAHFTSDFTEWQTSLTHSPALGPLLLPASLPPVAEITI